MSFYARSKFILKFKTKKFLLLFKTALSFTFLLLPAVSKKSEYHFIRLSFHYQIDVCLPAKYDNHRKYQILNLYTYKLAVF